MCTRWSAGGRALHVLAFVAALAALLIFVPAASAQLEDAWFEGNLSYDMVSGPGFTPYGTVTVVVKDAPGGTTLYSESTLVGAVGWFEAVPDVDLVPGMYISVSEGLATRELTLVQLSIDAISPSENTVTGTAPPNSTFWVDADVGGEWPGLDVTSDINGNWTADFDDTGVDITPYTHVGTSIGDEDGDQTAFDLQLMELPTFEVHRGPGGALVYFKSWTAGETLTLTIDDQTTEDSPDYETTVVAEDYQWPDDGFGMGVDYEVKPGDVVTVTDGTTTKSHFVTDIAVTAVDTAADVVSGTAAPGSELTVYGPGTNRWTAAAGDGSTWVVDFSVSDDPEQAVLDIVPGTRGGAEQFDADGDSTVYDWEAPRPEGWQHNPATGHDYLFVEDGMSWADAEAYAVSLGGHLVTINDAAENDWLIATLGTEYYIGMNDRALEGTWVWASGEPVTFTGWLPDQPDDYQGVQDAARIWNKPPIGWDDVSDSGWDPFVVEKSSDVTAPSIVLSPALYDGVTYGVSLLGQPLDFSVVDENGGSGASTNGSASVLVPGSETALEIPLTWTANANGSTSASGTLPTGVAGTYTLTLSGQDKAGNPVTRTLSYSVAGSVSPIAGLEGLPKDENGTPLLDLPTFTPRTSLTLSFTLLDSAGKPVKHAKPRLSVWDTATGTERFRAKDPFKTVGKDKGTYVYEWFPTEITWDPSWPHEYRDMQLIITFFDKKKGALVAATVQQGPDGGLVATPIPVAGARAATSSSPSSTSSKIRVRW